MQINSGKERRRTARIPVDAVLLYRAVGMDNFKLCHVLNVSTLSLEILLDRALPETTIVTIAVRPEGTSRQYYRVVGRVTRVQQQAGVWMPVITAPTAKPWPPMFIYDVLCSTFNPAPKNPVEEYETACRNQYAELKEYGANLDAWEAAILPHPLIGLEMVNGQTKAA